MSDSASFGELATASVVERVEVVRWAVARLPLGSDAEAVHDTRVALRRLAEALRGFETCVAAADRKRVRQLRRMEGRLGPWRDAEVRLQLLEEVLGPVAVWRDRSDDPRAASVYGTSVIAGVGLPTRPGLRGLEMEARRLLADITAAEVATQRDRMLSGLGRKTLSKLTSTPGIVNSRRASLPALRMARSQLPGLFRKAAKARAGGANLHQRRIRTRRLRYRLELYGPVLGGEHTLVLQELRAVQGLLGRFHDLAVLVEWIDDASLRQRRELRPALRRLTVRVELEHQVAQEVAAAELHRLDDAGWWEAAQRACLS